MKMTVFLDFKAASNLINLWQVMIALENRGMPSRLQLAAQQLQQQQRLFDFKISKIFTETRTQCSNPE
jgi:hypothetical protein